MWASHATQRTVDRAIVLGVLSFRSLFEGTRFSPRGTNDPATAKAMAAGATEWLRDAGLWRALTEPERALLEMTPLTWEKEPTVAIQGAGLPESTAALLWSLRVIEEFPTYERAVDADALLRLLPFMSDSPFVTRQGMSPVEEYASMAGSVELLPRPHIEAKERVAGLYFWRARSHALVREGRLERSRLETVLREGASHSRKLGIPVDGSGDFVGGGGRQAAALRVQKILARQGRTLDGTGERDAHHAQGAEKLALSACYGAAASGLGLARDRAGQPLLRIVEPTLARQAEPVAEIMGFNVHAQVAIPARDRARLERLCRYVCRPPIAQDRAPGRASFSSSSSVTTTPEARTTSHAESLGPGCCATFSARTSSRVRTAPGRCAGSRPPRLPTRSRGCSPSMASDLDLRRRARLHQVSSDSRFPGCERGVPGTADASVAQVQTAPGRLSRLENPIRADADRGGSVLRIYDVLVGFGASAAAPKKGALPPQPNPIRRKAV